jgi:hypothetical protein
MLYLRCVRIVGDADVNSIPFGASTGLLSGVIN